MRAPRSTSSASGVWATAAASRATARRRSWLRAAWTRRRAFRPWARPEELTKQAEQALGLGPALHRVLLVAGRACNSARRQTQAWAWSRRPIRRSASAWSRTRTPARRSSRGQVPTMSIASSKASGSRSCAISASAFRRSWVVAVALDAGEQEAAAQLLGRVVLEHRLGAPPAVRVDAGAGERGPDVLLGVVEVLDGDPPELALEHLRGGARGRPRRGRRASRPGPGARGRGEPGRRRSRRRGRRRGRAGCEG